MERRNRHDRWLVLGVVLSLALHLGVARYFQAKPRPKPPESPPMEMVFFDVTPPAPKAETPPPEEPKPSPRPAPQPVVRAPPPPLKPTAPEPPPEPRPPAVATDAPVADVPRAMPSMQNLAKNGLLPSVTKFIDLDGGVEVDDPTGLHALDRSKDLATETMNATLSRNKVARGMVHPYYAQLGKVLVKQWDADRAVSSKGLKGFGEQTVQNMKAWNSIWLERANQFGKTGAPVDAQASDPRMQTDSVTGSTLGRDLQARKEVQKAMGDQFKMSRKAEIRVTQDEMGKLLKVELVKPSNDEHVDKEALLDVRAAAEKLPPPPAEAMMGKKTLVSTWEFELIISITPPIPTFSFEFDEVLGFVDTRMPLDRRIYKKVKLLAVE